MLRKYLVVGIILVVVANNNLFVANAHTAVEGGVYEVSTNNPETSGSSGTLFLCATFATISGSLIIRK